ncbi:MAG: PEP-CTERM sorting domain-containing protein [Gammaproteobacteria bacterium]|nr:MAG: PEP-CTERM sorting domain-containing protein [Gammaproteobacteria bacterium]
MIRYIALLALLCLPSSNSFASFIYADDFDVGADRTHLTDNATLSWLSGTNNVSTSKVHTSGALYHQHFGGLVDAATYQTTPGLLHEALGSPNSYSYGALQIDFDAPARSFGMKVENLHGDGFGVYVFGTDGSFMERLDAYVEQKQTSSGGPYFDGSFHWDFNYDVGQIKLGSNASSGYVYALDVTQVPEPSSLILLAIGVLCVFKVRRSINSSVQQEAA